jgi:IS30 family transposase
VISCRQTRRGATAIRDGSLLERGESSLHAALVARMQDLPPALIRSITWDRGTEMARHLATADKLRTPVYFCDSPITLATRQQREHQRAAAGLLPQGRHPINYSLGHLMEVEGELNNRPRMVLQDRCPADLFAVLLSPTRSVGVATLTRTHPGADNQQLGRRAALPGAEPHRGNFDASGNWEFQ